MGLKVENVEVVQEVEVLTETPKTYDIFFKLAIRMPSPQRGTIRPLHINPPRHPRTQINRYNIQGQYQPRQPISRRPIHNIQLILIHSQRMLKPVQMKRRCLNRILHFKILPVP